MPAARAQAAARLGPKGPGSLCPRRVLPGGVAPHSPSREAAQCGGFGKVKENLDFSTAFGHKRMYAVIRKDKEAAAFYFAGHGPATVSHGV
jgi:hypothetical protein